jgi:hypothetical protein
LVTAAAGDDDADPVVADADTDDISGEVVGAEAEAVEDDEGVVAEADDAEASEGDEKKALNLALSEVGAAEVAPPVATAALGDGSFSHDRR